MNLPDIWDDNRPLRDAVSHVLVLFLSNMRHSCGRIQVSTDRWRQFWGRTCWYDGLPSKRLFYDCIDVGEVGTVSKAWESIITNDAFQLLLSTFKHSWIEHHGQEECPQGANGLKASCSVEKKQIIRVIVVPYLSPPRKTSLRHILASRGFPCPYPHHSLRYCRRTKGQRFPSPRNA